MCKAAKQSNNVRDLPQSKMYMYMYIMINESQKRMWKTAKQNSHEFM